jgi:hypothetical protein
MKLSKQDADIFYKMMWSLLVYVNQKLGILTEEVTVDDFARLPHDQIFEVREALYDNKELIDAFVQDNPQGLKAEELDIVKGWNRFIRGDFFIERLLKKYAIFIGGEAVYGVLALYDPFEELLPFWRLPYYVRAVLLPYKGKIVYDGLLKGYAIYFGGGIKTDLRETYMSAKQNGNIIESLDPRPTGKKSVRARKPAKDWGTEIEALAQEASKLRASAGSLPIHSPAFSLVKASIAFARTAIQKPDDLDELWKALEKVERQLQRAETTLYRLEY